MSRHRYCWSSWKYSKKKSSRDSSSEILRDPTIICENKLPVELSKTFCESTESFEISSELSGMLFQNSEAFKILFVIHRHFFVADWRFSSNSFEIHLEQLFGISQGFFMRILSEINFLEIVWWNQHLFFSNKVWPSFWKHQLTEEVGVAGSFLFMVVGVVACLFDSLGTDCLLVFCWVLGDFKSGSPTFRLGCFGLGEITFSSIFLGLRDSSLSTSFLLGSFSSRWSDFTSVLLLTLSHRLIEGRSSFLGDGFRMVAASSLLWANTTEARLWEAARMAPASVKINQLSCAFLLSITSFKKEL